MGCRPWEGFTEEGVAKMRVEGKKSQEEKYLGVRVMWEGLETVGRGGWT